MQALWVDGAGFKGRCVEAKGEPVSFAVRGRRFLYEPNDMSLVECDAAQQELAARNAPAFAVAKPQFELGVARPRMAVLILTHACNLRCRYCFQGTRRELPAQQAEPAVMSLEVAEAALDMLPRKGGFSIGFFGGEPLLFPLRLREIVLMAEERAAKEGARPGFSLTTNATLLDEGMAGFLDAHGFSLIVSLDGPAHLHDAMRPLAGGGGSHEGALSGLAALAKFPRLAARTTLRSTFIDSPAQLVERLEYLNQLADQHGLRNVSVEPADLSEGCAAPAPRGEGRVFSEALQAEYEAAADWWLARMRAGKRPRFHHFAVRLRRLARREAHASECGAGCGYIAVNPAGEIFACHREGDTRIGMVASGIDTALQADWRDNRHYARHICGSCWLRHACGGGCRYNSVSQGMGIHVPEPFGCRLAETCIKQAAWILAESTPSEREAIAAGTI